MDGPPASVVRVLNHPIERRLGHSPPARKRSKRHFCLENLTPIAWSVFIFAQGIMCAGGATSRSTLEIGESRDLSEIPTLPNNPPPPPSR